MGMKDKPNKVTTVLKVVVTGEFYDDDATEETLRYAVEQDLEDAGFDVDVALLKDQEAVKPVEEFIKGTNCHYYHCKRCGNIVGTVMDDKHPIFPGVKLQIKHFCDVCGQAVKWE